MSNAVKGADEKFCHECGELIRAKAEICPKCGVRQPGYAVAPSSTSEKNRVAAGVFALILGGIGAHKFYLGKVGQGLLYLLFCWTLIPAVAGVIEGIIYLTMSDESFEDKYVYPA